MRVITLARLLAVTAATFALLIASACGGGGSGTTQTTTAPSVPLQITTESILPPAIQQRAYSTMLVAQGGQGALHWSIAAVGPNTLFVDGLAVDSSTGVLSGTPMFFGTGAFNATVTDAANHTATRNFTVTAFAPLAMDPTFTVALSEFVDPGGFGTSFTGGIAPYKFRIANGSLPPGMRFSSLGGFVGGPIAAGSFAISFEVTDSFTPPEVATQQITFHVSPHTLEVAPSLPARLPVSVPFNGRVIARGGTPPYQFSLLGSLPIGFTGIDPATGKIAGTPTTNGIFNFTVHVSDSATPAQTADGTFVINVGPARGRNDSVATATPLPASVQASISPYIDPPDKAPTAADGDYYKIVSLPGTAVHIQTVAQQSNPNGLLDTVLEIVDANGQPFNTCNQPGNVSTTFTSLCLNDDLSSTPHIIDSALDFEVNGPPSTPVTFYAHVLDWRGDARPDMLYSLNVSGVIAPLTIQNVSVDPANRGHLYAQVLTVNQLGPHTWTITAGALPSGITMSADGFISGTTNTLGTFPFTVQVTDTSTPPQVATAQFTLQVVDPLTVTSPAILPDACVNQPYPPFTVQTSAGAPPVHFQFFGPFLGGITFDEATGTFSGTPTTAVGTATGTVTATDTTHNSVSQNIALTVKTCP